MADWSNRREWLRGGAALFGGAIAGCLASGTGGPDAVSMLAAGSLNNALENGLKPTVDAELRVEAHGSVEAARLVAGGQRAPDVVSLADVALFDSPLDASWYAEFATNSMVVAYDADSEGGRRVAEADRWFDPIRRGAASLGRTDPDLDPLGYRTLFVLELASDHYETDVDLREAIPTRRQVYPETQLVSQFETGAVDAAVTYRSMAVDRGYRYVDLPPAVDLSDPRHAGNYARASYDLPSGETVTGGLVSYGSTIRDGHRRGDVLDAFEAHVTGVSLSEFGFVVPDDYPRFTGDVPDAVAA